MEGLLCISSNIIQGLLLCISSNIIQLLLCISSKIRESWWWVSWSAQEGPAMLVSASPKKSELCGHDSKAQRTCNKLAHTKDAGFSHQRGEAPPTLHGRVETGPSHHSGWLHPELLWIVCQQWVHQENAGPSGWGMWRPQQGLSLNRLEKNANSYMARNQKAKQPPPNNLPQLWTPLQGPDWQQRDVDLQNLRWWPLWEVWQGKSLRAKNLKSEPKWLWECTVSEYDVTLQEPGQQKWCNWSNFPNMVIPNLGEPHCGDVAIATDWEEHADWWERDHNTTVNFQQIGIYLDSLGQRGGWLPGRTSNCVASPL